MPFAPTNTKKLPKRIAIARAHFQGGGWSYRTAAPRLGVSYQHLCEVLTGNRESARLVARIMALPPRKLSNIRKP